MCWWHCQELGWCEWLIAACVIWVLDRVLRIFRMSLFGYQQAHIEIINEESFKVTIKKPKLFHSGPGQFGYVYFSDPLLWFQNHPFTILNEGEYLVFYIKHKSGITGKIYTQLVTAGGKLTKKVCVEGPYGDVAPVAKYKNALMVAAGAGFPGVFGHALEMTQKDNPQNIKLIWVQKSFAGAQFR
ncbi:unnamed protein product [Ambrosiozyma monospora]|uniref:Unnamed protein product n=1 Tax=Ambrosiozyma monospora TaxID=43982 RepID=A0ACB5U8H5_AMBMO|nr:unnamed protein product [Ambrosiozyma monospora]